MPLSELGRRQASSLRERLDSQTVDAVISSDLVRARETAEIVFGVRAVETDARLRERYLGELEGLMRSEVADLFPEFLSTWRRDPSAVQVPGVEPFDAMVERISSFMETTRERFGVDATVACVSHGFLIRGLLSVTLGFSIGSLWRVAIENTSITELTVTPGQGYRAIRINDHAHLDRSGR